MVCTGSSFPYPDKSNTDQNQEPAVTDYTVVTVCVSDMSGHFSQMIMKARYNPLISVLFTIYCRLMIKRRFSRVVISGTISSIDRSLMVIANHISWWDGFWVEYLNIKLFRKSFYFMMLEEQLRKNWFFNYCGGFSIRKNSKSVIESLDYAAQLLCNSNNMVLIFPQGKIESSYRRNVMFERGIERIIRNSGEKKAGIVFVVNLVDFFSEPRPALYQYIEEYDRDDFSCSAIESAFNAFYNRCTEKQSQISE